LLAHGRWFSPGTSTSSTTKTGRHDIAEILLKEALKHQKNQMKKTKKNNFLVLNMNEMLQFGRNVYYGLLKR
jgi:hypothetical protein